MVHFKLCTSLFHTFQVVSNSYGIQSLHIKLGTLVEANVRDMQYFYCIHFKLCTTLTEYIRDVKVYRNISQAVSMRKHR